MFACVLNSIVDIEEDDLFVSIVCFGMGFDLILYLCHLRRESSVLANHCGERVLGCHVCMWLRYHGLNIGDCVHFVLWSLV